MKKPLSAWDKEVIRRSYLIALARVESGEKSEKLLKMLAALEKLEVKYGRNEGTTA